MSSDAIPATATTGRTTAAAGTATNRGNLWRRVRGGSGWKHALLILAVLFALYPAVWIVSASFNPVDSLSASTLIPEGLTLDNFREMVNSDVTPVGTWLWNSLYIGVIAGAGNVLVAAFAAFAFSRMRFLGRRALLTSLLVMQIFPQFLGFIAFFALAQSIGEYAPWFGLNTHLFLMAVYLGGAAGFNAYLLKGFLDSIPMDLDEAAVIDGATEWQLFSRIILPLARPMMAVIFIISFVAIFNEFVLASFLLSSTDQLTLPVGLQAFLAEGYNAKWGLLAATALAGSAPIVIVFLAAQKHIIGGLVAGGVKG
jgi:arabinogalactan oligomer / maltooligosaccharide transport system permease protein